MKYKVGDKVKINPNFGYRLKISEVLRRTGNVMTIAAIQGDMYCMAEEPIATWDELFIDGLFEIPIETRFEILDL